MFLWLCSLDTAQIDAALAGVDPALMVGIDPARLAKVMLRCSRAPIVQAQVIRALCDLERGGRRRNGRGLPAGAE